VAESPDVAFAPSGLRLLAQPIWPIRRVQMLNGLFGIGRAYKKLPPHHNFAELADNIDQLANDLMN
jgi:hypothetical protein